MCCPPDPCTRVISAGVMSVTVSSVLHLHPAPVRMRLYYAEHHKQKMPRQSFCPTGFSHWVTQQRKDTENRNEWKFSRPSCESDSPGRQWGCGHFGAIFQEGMRIQADEIMEGGFLCLPHQYSSLTVSSLPTLQLSLSSVSLFSLLRCLLSLSLSSQLPYVLSCTLCHLLLEQGSRRERDWDWDWDCNSLLSESSSLVRQTWEKYQAPVHKNISLENCTSNLPLAQGTFSLTTRTIICMSSYFIMEMKISIAVICLFSFPKKKSVSFHIHSWHLSYIANHQ